MATAWGEIEVKIKVAEVGQTWPATGLTSIGTVLEDSISITKEDGSLYQLKSTGGILVDEMKGEPTFKVNLTLIGIVSTFWTMHGTTTTAVASFSNSTKYAVSIASKVQGSKAFAAPYCTITGTPEFSEKTGWTVPLEITVLKGLAGYLFDLPVVA